MKVWAVMHNPCTHESDTGLISLHKTERETNEFDVNGRKIKEGRHMNWLLWKFHSKCRLCIGIFHLSR